MRAIGRVLRLASEAGAVPAAWFGRRLSPTDDEIARELSDHLELDVDEDPARVNPLVALRCDWREDNETRTGANALSHGGF